MNISGGSKFVAGPMPKHNEAPEGAAYSGLLECTLAPSGGAIADREPHAARRESHAVPMPGLPFRLPGDACVEWLYLTTHPPCGAPEQPFQAR